MMLSPKPITQANHKKTMEKLELRDILQNYLTNTLQNYQDGEKQKPNKLQQKESKKTWPLNTMW